MGKALTIGYTVFEINSALGARRAHFRGWAHDFRTCAPDVRTFAHPIIIAIYYIAQEKSRAHSFKLCVPKERTKLNLNFEHWVYRSKSPQ